MAAGLQPQRANSNRRRAEVQWAAWMLPPAEALAVTGHHGYGQHAAEYQLDLIFFQLCGLWAILTFL